MYHNGVDYSKKRLDAGLWLGRREFEWTCVNFGRLLKLPSLCQKRESNMCFTRALREFSEIISARYVAHARSSMEGSCCYEHYMDYFI